MNLNTVFPLRCNCLNHGFFDHELFKNVTAVLWLGTEYFYNAINHSPSPSVSVSKLVHVAYETQFLSHSHFYVRKKTNSQLHEPYNKTATKSFS